MDRNTPVSPGATSATVALRKESVDRNLVFDLVGHFYGPVALRKESVDRNTSKQKNWRGFCWSLSARRAWIEMARPRVRHCPGRGRSPQGERG